MNLEIMNEAVKTHAIIHSHHDTFLFVSPALQAQGLDTQCHRDNPHREGERERRGRFLGRDAEGAAD